MVSMQYCLLSKYWKKVLLRIHKNTEDGKGSIIYMCVFEIFARSP